MALVRIGDFKEIQQVGLIQFMALGFDLVVYVLVTLNEEWADHW